MFSGSDRSGLREVIKKERFLALAKSYAGTIENFLLLKVNQGPGSTFPRPENIFAFLMAGHFKRRGCLIAKEMWSQAHFNGPWQANVRVSLAGL